jgi:hypothetical protein
MYGTKISSKVPKDTLKKIFAILLAVVAMLYHYKEYINLDVNRIKISNNNNSGIYNNRLC